MTGEPHQTRGRRQDRRFQLALLGFLAIAAFFLVTEHRAHALGMLPFLLFLLCPLLHFFMHGGHGGHDAPASGQHDHAGHRRSGEGGSSDE